jgi:sugar phosphate isomerase/epimerase
MDRAISTHLFVQHRLTTALLERIWRADIPAVELFCARQHFDFRNTAQIAEIAHWFRDSTLVLHSVHAPIYNDDVWGKTGPSSHINIADPVKARRIQSVDEIKRTLEIAETVPYRYLIQHLGMAGEEFDMRKIDAMFSSLEELSVFARHRGAEVLLENIPNELSNSEKLNLFFNMTHMDLNICFDVGHAHLTGNLEAEYRALKPRIRSTNIHDNNGADDSHLFPSAEGGTLDWRSAMQLLRSAPGQYPLLLELREVPEMEYPLDAVNRVFDQLEGLKTAHEF